MEIRKDERSNRFGRTGKSSSLAPSVKRAVSLAIPGNRPFPLESNPKCKKARHHIALVKPRRTPFIRLGVESSSAPQPVVLDILFRQTFPGPLGQFLAKTLAVSLSPFAVRRATISPGPNLDEGSIAAG